MAGVQPHTVTVAAGQDAKAVVLDLVNPAGTGRRLFGWLWQAGCDGGMGTEGWVTHGLAAGSQSDKQHGGKDDC